MINVSNNDECHFAGTTAEWHYGKQRLYLASLCRLHSNVAHVLAQLSKWCVTIGTLSSSTANLRLQSADVRQLSVPQIKTNHGDRGFPTDSSATWNTLQRARGYVIVYYTFLWKDWNCFFLILLADAVFVASANVHYINILIVTSTKYKSI